MATTHGKGGFLVLAGTNAVAELGSWTLNESAAVADGSSMGDAWDLHNVGRNSWTGQADCWWDDTDTNGQNVLTVGSQHTISFRPEGNTGGDYEKEGLATVTAVNTTTNKDGTVQASFSFQGDGILTPGTV